MLLKISIFTSTVKKITTVCLNVLTQSDINNALPQRKSLKLRLLISKLTENAGAEEFWPKYNDMRHSMSSSKRRALFPVQEATSTEKSTWQMGDLPQPFCWQLLTKPSVATPTIGAVCNLCYSLTALRGTDKRMLVQRTVPRISTSVSAQGKSSLQAKSYPCQTCQRATLKILRWER